ncbi:hypothetical protein VNO80_10014 [Phaseolus coccineus]|uniref:phosphatidylinositol 3-kinase n=1 Tax=Phaseolus coccineus TaxID=3886 RepID=A0AAN9N7T9_PHACN
MRPFTITASFQVVLGPLSSVSALERADDEELRCYLLQLVQALRFERSDKSRLSHFLVQRGEYDDILEENMMKMAAGVNGEEDGFKQLQSLVRQTELTAQLCSITRDVRNVRGNTEKKIEKLRQLLSGLLSELTYFDEPIRSPLAPGVLISGIVPSESSIFKSALHPLRLTFRTTNGGTSKIIFKKGDDIRQDQLVVQMVSLMDRLLKLENLDLLLTPYKVLATGQDEGMLEFIPSRSLAQILSEHRSIISYLQKFHPDDHGPFGITATCLETFIKSCAGYSVITYILGIGDSYQKFHNQDEKVGLVIMKLSASLGSMTLTSSRGSCLLSLHQIDFVTEANMSSAFVSTLVGYNERHLDNLLLRNDGGLFHVDFGFILGRDPKPFPPPMKLCKEMVEAMGGAESQYYTRFKSYCSEAYNILCNVPDIASDPEKGILKLLEKFRLDLDDEASIHFFQDLINERVKLILAFVNKPSYMLIVYSSMYV